MDSGQKNRRGGFLNWCEPHYARKQKINLEKVKASLNTARSADTYPGSLRPRTLVLLADMV